MCNALNSYCSLKIAENAIEYNGDPNYETNKVICHRARALQDFAYALVKAEMVS
jgi:hypothetical protein